MKEETVKSILRKHGYKVVKHTSIFATIKPSVEAYNNGLGEIMYSMKDHILHLNKQGIVILPLDEMSGKIKEEQIHFLKEEDIFSKEINVHLLGYILTLHTSKGDVVYKIRKSIIGAPWHKENLSFLLLNSSAK